MDTHARLAGMKAHDRPMWPFATHGYCGSVKTITVSVDDETYRRARIKAAEQATSVSALVKRFLTELATDETDAERLRRGEHALRARIRSFSAADRLAREDVHTRQA